MDALGQGARRSGAEGDLDVERAQQKIVETIRQLEESGLISSEKTGRVRTCRIERRALRETEAWIHRHVASWERRLDRLEAHEADRQG